MAFFAPLLSRRLARPLAALAAAMLGFAVSVVPAAATKIQKVVSPSGIEAWLVEEHAVPMIAVDFAFRGGSSHDPAGREGLANLLSSLLDEGAGDLPSQEFQTKLEDLAIEFAFHDDADRFNGAMKTLSENRDEAFSLLALALQKPRFDGEAVERMRVQTIAALRSASKNPDKVASLLWGETLYPGHPYGRPADGTEASVAAITVDEIRAAHGRIFTRDGLKIAVVGDIDAATLAPLIDRVFAGLPEKGDLPPVGEVTPKAGVRAGKAMAVPQAVVRFGGPGLKRADPDFIAAYVMNHILGGGTFSSWLYTEVREKRGLAYSVASGLSPLVHTGTFVGHVGTAADKAEETLAVIVEQMARMRDVGPSAAELAEAKAYLVGSYPLRFDTSDKIAASLLAIQVDELGIDYIDRRNGLIEAVTLDDVRRVAKRLFAEPPSVVVVGPEKK